MSAAHLAATSSTLKPMLAVLSVLRVFVVLPVRVSCVTFSLIDRRLMQLTIVAL